MTAKFLVVESAPNLEPNSQYRWITLRGTTYTETGFRLWVADTWKTDPDQSISDLTKISARGGWLVYQLQEESL
jgi:hypothetical protein